MGIDKDVESDLKHTYNLKAKGKQNDKVIFKSGDENRNRNNLRKRDWQPKKNLRQVYPESFEEYFEYVDCWGWSSVMASYLVGGCPLRWTMYGIWRKYEFFELFEINKQTFLILLIELNEHIRSIQI